jgi:FtsZ-binding cell division protein ZapB
MAKTGQSVSLETFDRLEEKVTLLVALIGRMRTEQARTAEEHVRLTRELELARARVQDAEGTSAEVGSLKEERELIRTRVSSLLEQLDNLKL